MPDSEPQLTQEQLHATDAALFALLHEDLQKTVVLIDGVRWFHSPFLITFHNSLRTREEVDALTARYLRYRSLADQYRADRRFFHYIESIEHPYRLDALIEIQEELKDRQYWKLLARVYMDAEHPSKDSSVMQKYLRLFQSKRPNRVLPMNRRE